MSYTSSDTEESVGDGGDVGDGGSDELELFRQRIYGQVHEIKATGLFATGGVLHEYPNPGICVDEGEPIRLPLSEADAEALTHRSRKAPFGKNRETLIDETVRKTWEVDADKIDFRNPRWSDFVAGLVERVATELGVPSGADGSFNVRAELYKHLLYEPGAMFKDHKDTEKLPGMFGTLVICLPSKHTGGTVRLSHGNDSMILSTAESSAFDFSYLAWYADVTHEVSCILAIYDLLDIATRRLTDAKIEPVQTGYRWVLTYNLVNESTNSCPSALALDSQTESLAQALSGWDDLEFPPTCLISCLEHQYTMRSLGLAHLKGHDYQRARCVTDICARHDKLYLFLAHVVLFHRIPTDDWRTTEGSSQQSLCNISSPDGLSISSREFKIVKSQLFLDRINYDRKPHSRTGGEYRGNSHEDIEEIYLSEVMIIVPKEFLDVTLLGPKYSPKSLQGLMTHLRSLLTKDDCGEGDKTNISLRGILHQLCCNVLDAEKPAGTSKKDSYLGLVAVTAAFLGDASVFHRAQVKTNECWGAVSCSALGELIDLQGLSVDEKDLITALTKGDTLFFGFRSLYSFYQGFHRSNPGRKEEAKVEYAKQWYCDRLVEVLNTASHSMDDDPETVMDLVLLKDKVQYTPAQRVAIDEAIVNFISRFSCDKSFVNSLTVKLLLQLQNVDGVRRLFVLHLLRTLLEPAISTFDLELYYINLRTPSKKGRSVLQDSGEEFRISDAGLIRSFYEWAGVHSEDATSRLLWKLQMQASKANRAIVNKILQPLLAEIISLVNTGSPEVQYCVQSLVKTYLTETVGKEPLKPVNWARPAEANRECTYPESCTKCTELKVFLADPVAEQHTMEFGGDAWPDTKWHAWVTFNFFEFLKTEEVDGDNETLIITKTLKWWENCHRDWELEVAKATELFQGLSQDKLKEVLGDQYDTFMAF